MIIVFILMEDVIYVVHEFFIGETKLLISNDVFNKLQGYRQDDRNKPESGGLLIGRTDIHGNTSILDITTPMKHDIRHRCGFNRLDKKHIEIIRVANEKCLYFKGNWHTHPQEVPEPSWLDKISWNKAMKQSRPGESEFVYFIIIGTNSVRIWCGNMLSKNISEMEMFEGGDL